jgi:hypothetical protein
MEMDKLDSAIANAISENFHDLKDFRNIKCEVPSSDKMLKEIYRNVKKEKESKLSVPAKRKKRFCKYEFNCDIRVFNSNNIDC